MEITREQMNRLQDQITKLQTDLYYKAGDTLKLNLVSVNGFITNNAKTIHLSVTAGKSLKNIGSITVTTMTGSIIGDMGYVDNSNTNRDWKAVEGIAIVAEIKDEYLIEVRFTTAAAMANVNNNRPVAYYPSNTTVGGLVLTFGG